jgi:hypothetical protein
MPEELAVAFDLFLDRRGSVARLPQLPGDSETAGDPSMRAL